MLRKIETLYVRIYTYWCIIRTHSTGVSYQVPGILACATSQSCGEQKQKQKNSKQREWGQL